MSEAVGEAATRLGSARSVGRRPAVVLVVAVLGASATVPRWWAHRVGAQVDGSITQGTLLGLVYGFVFTFLPIIAFVLIIRWRRTWKTVVVALVVGVLLAPRIS